jgi:hypothetical protein
MVVTVDYFTMWAEVKAMVNITAKGVEWFLWKNVVCRYRISRAFALIMGNNLTVTHSRSGVPSST